MSDLLSQRAPLCLTVLLLVLIYFLRISQGEWKLELELFKPQRDYLANIFHQTLPSSSAKLLSGIVLGQKQDLPPELKLALRDTSTLHIVVVSGQNLTLLAGFLICLAGLLRRKVVIILTLTIITLYTLLTGGDIPVLRAAFMAGFSFVAQLFGRQGDGLRALIVTAGALLLINPFWITDLSFQLSFLATMGMLLIAPIIEQKLSFLPSFISSDLSITLGAQILVTPIIAQYFNQLSIVGVLANIFILWTIPLIMILGALLLICYLIFPILGLLVALVVNIFLTYLIYVVEFFSSFDWAWVYIPTTSWLVWLGYYLIIAAILLLIKNSAKKVETIGSI